MNDFDDQTLGAFVDGQLDAETSESIINSMDKNQDTRDRVYQLRRVKDLMKIGFADITLNPVTRKRTTAWKRYSTAIAASITALVISFGSGLSGYYFGTQNQLSENSFNAGLQKQKPKRVLLHISESNLEHFSKAMNYAEKFLIEHKNDEDKIAVIVNAGGLDLVRTGVSPFEKKILNFINKYDNIHFIACANSVKSLQKKGIKLELIDNIRVNKPAMDHIIEYVKDGWSYTKVNSISAL